MDWYPLWNSLRIALVSCAAVFFLGIFAAYYIAKLPRTVKGALDVVLTLPMVLPPTVVGYFLLLLFGAKRPLGAFFMEHFGVKLVMNWYSAIFASIVVAFPLMYRTARGAFESFDETLAWSAQTLGQSGVWIFWRDFKTHARPPAFCFFSSRFTASSTTAEITISTSTQRMAPASSLVRHSWYTVVAMVAVLPGV